MLSPKAEETMPAQNIAERGKERAEDQESDNSKLLSLLTKMREEMKRRDKQLQES